MIVSSQPHVAMESKQAIGTGKEQEIISFFFFNLPADPSYHEPILSDGLKRGSSEVCLVANMV